MNQVVTILIRTGISVACLATGYLIGRAVKIEKDKGSTLSDKAKKNVSKQKDNPVKKKRKYKRKASWLT